MTRSLPGAATVWLAIAAALLLLLAAAAPPAGADDDDDAQVDEPDLERYDARSPDRAWQTAIGLGSLGEDADGAGVTVAVLDTGVTRHPDLGDRVAARVDLTPYADGDDRYGHGTHMTGIIAGGAEDSEGDDGWPGVAPGTSVVPVKVAGWNGATDVTAVAAALEWIAAHRERYGIRVVNLSYGTDGVQDPDVDPLNHAVQRLWRAGVLVVVGAGNRGARETIEKPGDDPFVLTVGAADTKGTARLSDDEVAPFSSRGPTHAGHAKPDLVAPGVSIVSHRAAGSTVDQVRPAARLGDRYFKGTGTSQASAVVSGVAALLFQEDPSLTPAEAKAVLIGTASPALAGRPGAGAGMVDAAAAMVAVRAGSFAGRRSDAGVAPSTGLGRIDRSRGSFRPYTDWRRAGRPEPLRGEVDALGRRWDAEAYAARPWVPATWAASPWAAHTAVAEGWRTAAPVMAWSGLGWDESSWTAKSWGDAGLPEGWVAKSWGASQWNG
jgi:serine protease AprX